MERQINLLTLISYRRGSSCPSTSSIARLPLRWAAVMARPAPKTAASPSNCRHQKSWAVQEATAPILSSCSLLVIRHALSARSKRPASSGAAQSDQFRAFPRLGRPDGVARSGRRIKRRIRRAHLLQLQLGVIVNHGPPRLGDRHPDSRPLASSYNLHLPNSELRPIAGVGGGSTSLGIDG